MQLNDSSSSSGRQGSESPKWVVVVGASTGGPQALAQLLPQFPSNFPGAIIVIQKMRPGFTRVLADQFSQTCELPICECLDGQALHCSRILMAPSGSSLSIINVGTAAVPVYSIVSEDIADAAELENSRVDFTMTSAAGVFGERAIGVLLTGIGVDGREGMRAIANAGGTTIAQDEATSVVHSLPASAIDAGVVNQVLPLWNIAEFIMELTGGKVDANAA